ncbi:hypothetical protein FVW20_00560 [Desulfovibrio oxamicus]|uniref:DksA C4-type domain-containing protein n=1 Tax=Nitratidesulfovibrio oxamicus TaxID=32016 RepID=A0ABS0J019_9BACT|nr:zinc ribbon domain-containing protein [Nitratidesulfovibrio oxamicus]MBG3875555.1 hypothetical protein [Nitratidesulfovibrio oxamicus]
MSTTCRRFPVSLRLPQAAFNVLEARSHAKKQTVDSLAVQIILQALLEDGDVWICQACGHVLSDRIPATPDPETNRSICPACVQNASANPVPE